MVFGIVLFCQYNILMSFIGPWRMINAGLEIRSFAHLLKIAKIKSDHILRMF